MFAFEIKDNYEYFYKGLKISKIRYEYNKKSKNIVMNIDNAYRYV